MDRQTPPNMSRFFVLPARRPLPLAVPAQSACRRRKNFSRAVLALAVFAGLFSQQSVLACAACYGASDAPMARGMNWGILSLLAVIGAVLAGFAVFFVYLARRAAASPVLPAAATLAESAVRL